MNRLVVKPGKGYVKIALIFFFLAIAFFLLIMITYAPSHDDTVEGILVTCVLPAMVGMVPMIIYRNVKMVFDSSGVLSINLFGVSKKYSWEEITEGRLMNNGQYRCVLYANGKKVGSAIFSYDGYVQMLDLMLENRLLQKSDLIEKAKWRAGISQPGGLVGLLKEKIGKR